MIRAQTFFILMMFFIGALTSCDQDEPTPDYGNIISGTYTGTVITGSGTITGVTTITKRSETRVDMDITAGSHNLKIPGVRVSSVEDNVYTLSFTFTGNSLAGEVEGNNLTYTLSSGVLNGTFTGTR